MIAQLRGAVAHLSGESLVLDVGGVGYLVHVPLPLAERLSPGQPLTLATRLVVREGEMSLFGFSTPHEREIFGLLIGLTGVGPKLALKILSALSPSALASAIVEEDVATLTRIPGVGPKTARRLLLELSERLTSLAPSPGVPGLSAQDEAEAVLISLGCERQEAREAVRAAADLLGEEPGVESLVMSSLKVLGQG